ncbi:hypothetical protein BN1095_170002 [Clostridioides difficile]|uniref:Uncharacterized protein n=2 Tax=Clostridioides difficile TaxID=1496 RepID=A0A068ZWU2_CLODI|nr:hypothetical protein BN1096_140001 [Clostridioides difficile]CDS93848.1 hypothetical protein BN1095_170002 [Clostridioides difficile]
MGPWGRGFESLHLDQLKLLVQLVRVPNSWPVILGFESMKVILHRGVAQLVERRSPKPCAGGSSPSTPAK